MIWEMKISKVQNGYILETTTNDENNANGVTIEKMVIQERNEEIDANVELLYTIMEYFGFSGSKHDKERIYIEVREKNE